MNIIQNMGSSVDYDGKSALKPIHEDEPEVMIPYLKMPGIDGKYNIGIRVSDNGFDISEKDLKVIFEPFFTPKTSESGTGLGLPITYGLVKGIRGSINASFKNGKMERISLQNLSKSSFKSKRFNYLWHMFQQEK